MTRLESFEIYIFDDLWGSVAYMIIPNCCVPFFHYNLQAKNHSVAIFYSKMFPEKCPGRARKLIYMLNILHSSLSF